VPSVTARSRGVWRITLELGHDPKTGRRKRMVRDIRGSKKEAQAELARLVHQRRTGEYVEPHKETLAGFLTRWLAYMNGRLAPSAHASYSYVVALRLIPVLGAIPLQQLQPAHIAEAERQWLTSGRVGSTRAAYGRGLSPKTVVNYHRVLRAALQHAVRWNLLRFNPCDQMEPPRWERVQQRVLTLSEVRGLLDVLGDDRHGVALHTLLATGLRVGELLGLRWREDIDFDAGTIRVQQQYDRVTKTFRDTKTHRSKRPVAIDLELIAALRHHRAAQAERQLIAGSMWQPTGLVFTDNLGGHLDHDMLRKALSRCLRLAGLDPVNPHGLRHTHASLMIALGTHMRVLQERLGHASFAITADTYSHVSATAQHEAAALLGDALRKGKDR
jgi:integrase